MNKKNATKQMKTTTTHFLIDAIASEERAQSRDMSSNARQQKGGGKTLTGRS